MFYPSDSLRRGGKFYLCWVADSWPGRFDLVPKRILLATDIRKICDDLMDVVTRESGFASARFSLRLSSQLLRGLVRIYKRKAKSLLGDLLHINSNVTKYLHRKYHLYEPKPKRRPRIIHQVIDIVELPQETEERIAEGIQNSGNVVTNLDEITLREAPLPQLQQPTDDFGEENPEQALALLQDRTLEHMLAASGSGLRVSTYEAETSDLVQDATRAPQGSHVMDVISELDNTIFNKTAHEKRMTFDENELRDIQQIPEIPYPELLNPQPELLNPQPELLIPQTELPFPQPDVQLEPIVEVAETVQPPAVIREDPELLLESLEEQHRVRRRRRRLAVDRVIMIPSEQFRSRIQDDNVEMRCQSARDEITQLEIPVAILFQRPVHAGHRFYCNISPKLLRNFQRNLGFITTRNMEEQERDILHELRVSSQPQHTNNQAKETEAHPPDAPLQTEAEPQTDLISHQNTTATLEDTITRVIENVKEMEAMASEIDEPTKKVVTSTETETTTEMDTSVEKVVEKDKPVEKCGFEPECLQEPAVPVVPIGEEVDTSMLPTQKLPTPLAPKRQRIGLRDSDKENELIERKKRRSSKPGLREGVKEAKGSQGQIREDVNTFEPPIQESAALEPVNPEEYRRSHVDVEGKVSQVLMESGIPDNREVQEYIASVDLCKIRVMSTRLGRRTDSDSETPLGSLDRTEVDFGSDDTTESNRKVKNEWGVHGTLIKILNLERRLNRPFTFDELLSSRPIQRNNYMVAANCFSSLLKLKQQGFVIMTKLPPSLEIDTIKCGEKALRILN